VSVPGIQEELRKMRALEEIIRYDEEGEQVVADL
jgi:hypothetical protein